MRGRECNKRVTGYVLKTDRTEMCVRETESLLVSCLTRSVYVHEGYTKECL